MVNVDSDSSIVIRPIKPKNVIILPTSLSKKKVLNTPKHEEFGDNWGLNDLFTPVDREDTPIHKKEFGDNWGLNNNVFTPVDREGKPLSCVIDQMFDKYDDIHAPFPITCEDSRTPPTYSAIIDQTPSPIPTSPQKYVSEETRRKRILATIEGRNDFCEILEHAGINSAEYLAKLFGSKNKHEFGCSTPIVQTPILNKTNRIATPLPLSGIRFLPSPLSGSKDCTGDYSLTTPASKSSYKSECVNQDKSYFPVTENMKNILHGITCYVDVRTEKENRNEACKRELLSIGAKVEKNFIKKVTHVIFKEGKMSTYLKAKKLNIPIVSVVWIEACKIAHGPVDPALYPPTRMEKYEDKTPFTMLMEKIRKRNGRVPKFMKNLNGGGSLNLSPTVQKSIRRRVKTEVKENVPPTIDNHKKERPCTKKLNFIDIDESKSIGDKNDLITIDLTALSDSSEFAKFKLDILPKRKSAPGALAKKKKMKMKTLNDYYTTQKKNLNQKSKILDEKDVISLDNSSLLEDFESEKNNKCVNFVPITVSKKRKLYDPTSSPIISNIQSQNVDFSYPYCDTPSPAQKKRKLQSNVKKQNNRNNGEIETNLPVKNLELAEEQEGRSSRTSLSFFVDNDEKIVRVKTKQTPVIVFTSIHSSECAKLSLIVKKLGIFEIEDQVTEKTTHVVTSSLRRTLNLLKGFARGCWILEVEWIYKSEVAKKWLAEEHFEFKTICPAVTECRLQRQAFKKAFYMDLFSTCGPIYVSPNTNPSTQDLIDLIKLCRGKVVTCGRGAQIIIGDKSICERSIVRVREKWILDSIFHNKLLDYEKYIVCISHNKKKLPESGKDNK